MSLTLTLTQTLTLTLTQVNDQVRRLSWTILPTATPIVRASAGAEAGVRGAGAHALASPAARFGVRQATAADRAGVMRVCLRTGDEGADATAQYAADPDALGKRWAAPYVDLERELALVLEDRRSGEVVGYCLAALDTARFAARLQSEYLPPLRAAHANPRVLGVPESAWTAEQSVYAELHDPHAGKSPVGLDTALYPSHVHIDVVQVAQGCGQGKRLMGAMLSGLRALGSCGVFLQMHEANVRARRFYEKLGFEELAGVGTDGPAGTGGALYLGLRL